MIGGALAKVFGTSNERAVKRLLPGVQSISDLEPAVQALSDEQLRAKTAEFRARIAAALEGITDEKERSRGGESKLWTRFCPRPLPWCARRVGAL